jgi:hypothetical protein
MAISKKNLILFNGAAALLVVASIGYALRTHLVAHDEEPCMTRYLQGARFGVERDGRPMAGSDLQARMGGTDWGVLDRLRVVKLKSGPSPYAVEFDLTAAKADDRNAENGREGVGFIWSPRSMGKGTAACLAYSVFLPEGFDFGGGGRLPGLMGLGADGEAPEQGLAVLSTRYVWRETGAADIYAHVPGLLEGRSFGNERYGFALAKGRWMSLEQEVVLNRPGQRDGLVRVWVDGVLKMQKTKLELQGDKPVRLTGVLSEVVPMERDFDAKAKSQKIWLSPFEVRWN